MKYKREETGKKHINIEHTRVGVIHNYTHVLISLIQNNISCQKINATFTSSF